VWGTRASGKTTFLGMLYLQAVAKHGGFEFIVAQPPAVSQEQHEWTVDFVANAKETMRDRGEFLEATQKPMEFVFQVSRIVGDRQPQISLLRLIDRPGEYYNPKSTEHNAATLQETTDELAKSQGILCLLDMERILGASGRNPDGYFREFVHLFSKLPRNPQDGKVIQPVVLCLNKADLCWDYYQINGFTADQVFENHVDEFTRREISRYLASDRLKVCLCSAIGTVEDEHGRLRPNVIQIPGPENEPKFRIARPDRITPHNLFEPMDWLFDRLYGKR